MPELAAVAAAAARRRRVQPQAVQSTLPARYQYGESFTKGIVSRRQETQHNRLPPRNLPSCWLVTVALLVAGCLSMLGHNGNGNGNSNGRLQLLRGHQEHAPYFRRIPSLWYQDAYDEAHQQRHHKHQQQHQHQHQHQHQQTILFARASEYLSGERSIENKCKLTVLLLDAELATAGPGHALWFALESVALHTNEETTCFLLQHVSSNNDINIQEEDAYQTIYHRSLPAFRKAIEHYRVRVSFFSAKTYNIQHKRSSSSSKTTNAAFMNIKYWKNEFHSDTDLILVINADSVLCRDLNIFNYQHYAWVGAVLPEAACLDMPAQWNQWVQPQRQWEQQQADIVVDANFDHFLPQPRMLLTHTDFPSICTAGNTAPIGGQGLSLRSRRWMMRAIEACPHEHYSGIIDLEGLGCKVLDPTIENDVYFGTLLRGMRAPLPDAYDAALFSSETLWPEDVMERYYVPGGTDVGDIAAPRIKYHDRMVKVPIGCHKQLWDAQPRQSAEDTSNDELQDACPMLRYIVE